MVESKAAADPEDIAQFAAEKWVRVMCDHSTEGVWHRDGTPAQVHALPVSADLRERIRAWQELFESSVQVDGSIADPLFGEMGKGIARSVKSELPDWTVIYFDEPAYAKLRHLEGVGRPLFEYSVESQAPSGVLQP